MYIISVFLCMVWVAGVAERPVKEHSSFTSDPAATDTSTTRNHSAATGADIHIATGVRWLSSTCG
jgi:hypothetical protein